MQCAVGRKSTKLCFRDWPVFFAFLSIVPLLVHGSLSPAVQERIIDGLLILKWLSVKSSHIGSGFVDIGGKIGEKDDVSYLGRGSLDLSRIQGE